MKPLVLIACLGLTACASLSEKGQAQVAARDSARCESYGFKEGTDAFAQCRLTIATARSQGGPAPPIYTPAQRPAPTSCTTGVYGSQAWTTCQ